MNREELEGTAEALKARFKQAAGDLTNNPLLYDEGVTEETRGDRSFRLARLLAPEPADWR